MGRQFHGRRVVLQFWVCLKKAIDPNREGKSRTIEHVLLETFGAPVYQLVRRIFVLGPAFLEQRIAVLIPFLAAFFGLMAATHFWREVLIALWIVYLFII